MTTQSYYIQKMKEHLSIRQRQNPHYSLRAYARDLDIHPSTLSKIIKGERSLPLKNAQRVVEKMSLSPKERTLFMDTLLMTRVKLDTIKIAGDDTRLILDESHHSVISEWEHFAVLELFNLEGFICTPEAVALRLGLTPTRATVVLANLQTSDLIKDEAGVMTRTHTALKTTEDIASVAIRKSHAEILDMAKSKLESVEVELRDFSSTTLAIDLAKMPEAKQIIREFRKKMTGLMKEGNKTEVYKISIQFFPLSESMPSQEQFQ